MTMYTKGKWNVSKRAENGRVFLNINPSTGSGSIAILKEGSFKNPESAEEYTYDNMMADAHLIAAAPEMYEALEMALKNLSYLPVENHFAIEHIKNVLSGARGDGHATQHK